jgi:hypothetical protein
MLLLQPAQLQMAVFGKMIPGATGEVVQEPSSPPTTTSTGAEGEKSSNTLSWIIGIMVVIIVIGIIAYTIARPKPYAKRTRYY